MWALVDGRMDDRNFNSWYLDRYAVATILSLGYVSTVL